MNSWDSALSPCLVLVDGAIPEHAEAHLVQKNSYDVTWLRGQTGRYATGAHFLFRSHVDSTESWMREQTEIG